MSFPRVLRLAAVWWAAGACWGVFPLQSLAETQETAAGSQTPEEAQQQFEQYLESLKTTDPDAYLRLKLRMDRQQAIGQILSAFQQQQLDVAAAEQRLRPLVRDEVALELASANPAIASAKRLVEQLEAVKRDPDLLVQRRLDQLLGRAQAAPELWESFLMMQQMQQPAPGQGASP
jgi:hypothetical protein